MNTIFKAASMISFLLTSSMSYSAKPPISIVQKQLLLNFKAPLAKSKDLEILKKKVLSLKGKAVPTLIKVMKSGHFPDKNRWVATFLLGKVMGKKSAPFISKFVIHPNWVMRMASLKALLALRQKNYVSLYVRALKDKSLLVRTQALENIRRFDLKAQAVHVWAMLYDKKNYHQLKQGSKRSRIVKNIIKTIGELRFKKALQPLLKMIQKKKYRDIFGEMDQALCAITGKDSPKGSKTVKRYFWQRVGVETLKI